uniref:hypothetical protein n=1 Tax=Enterobacter hormaechei TaxID=158836 RepID=UPI0023A8A779|nr:hypothetical protein [Enterobacter hormaechei]WCS70547.1 hypothetical protein [Enterobacter hormaechei]
MALTIRTKEAHEAELDAVGLRIGEKTRSQTMLKCLMQHRALCDEIAELRAELRKVQAERDSYKSRIERFREAQRALFE